MTETVQSPSRDPSATGSPPPDRDAFGGARTPPAGYRVAAFVTGVLTLLRADILMSHSMIRSTQFDKLVHDVPLVLVENGKAPRVCLSRSVSPNINA